MNANSEPSLQLILVSATVIWIKETFLPTQVQLIQVYGTPMSWLQLDKQPPKFPTRLKSAATMLNAVHVKLKTTKLCNKPPREDTSKLKEQLTY